MKDILPIPMVTHAAPVTSPGRRAGAWRLSSPDSVPSPRCPLPRSAPRPGGVSAMGEPMHDPALNLLALFYRILSRSSAATSPRVWRRMRQCVT